MSRFYTASEISKLDMKLNEDLLKNPVKFKEELKLAINAENHRTNVDSAKKSAVSQYMDYDGFHQMVLGADLKGMKMDDVVNIKPEKGILNPVIEIRKMNQQSDMFFKDFIPVETTSPQVNVSKAMNFGAEELTLFQFKRKWMSFTSTEAKISYMTDHIATPEAFNEMINKTQLDASIFSEFLYHFGLYMKTAITDKVNQEKVAFVFKCLEAVLNNKLYPNLKLVIAQKHRTVYSELAGNPLIKAAFPSIDIISKTIIN